MFSCCMKKKIANKFEWMLCTHIRIPIYTDWKIDGKVWKNEHNQRLIYIPWKPLSNTVAIIPIFGFHCKWKWIAWQRHRERDFKSQLKPTHIHTHANANRRIHLGILAPNPNKMVQPDMHLAYLRINSNRSLVSACVCVCVDAFLQFSIKQWWQSVQINASHTLIQWALTRRIMSLQKHFAHHSSAWKLRWRQV